MTLQFGSVDWVHKGSSDQVGWGWAAWRTSVAITPLLLQVVSHFPAGSSGHDHLVTAWFQ